MKRMIPVWVAHYLGLIDQGMIRIAEIDHVVSHYSAHSLREEVVRAPHQGWRDDRRAQMVQAISRARAISVPASIFILLEEFYRSGALQARRARFSATCLRAAAPSTGTCCWRSCDVGPALGLLHTPAFNPPVFWSPPSTSPGGDARPAQTLGRASPPASTKCRSSISSTATSSGSSDYRELLLNHRQQVVEGARWIARASSSIDKDYFELRSRFLKHAITEHRDFQMIERDYVSVGGRLEEIVVGGEEHRHRGAARLHLPSRRPAQPVRSPRRHVHHRGSWPEEGRRLGPARQGALGLRG